MSSSKPIKATEKTDQETLRELSNLRPDEFLSRIAHELKSRLKCETVCLLLWYEVVNNLPLDRHGNNGHGDAGALVTKYQAGLPEGLLDTTKEETDSDPNSPRGNSEIYFYGEGITGGYIFKDRKFIRARIEWEPRSVFDEASQQIVSLADINWPNMSRFRMESKYKDFRSLLGLPLEVKGQQIGVLKLINKLAADSDTLAEQGFTDGDLEQVKNFLATIELVIETKTNEKQIKSLLEITEKITSADFNFDNLLQETAISCAKALNLRACIIRLLDQQSLTVRGSSVGKDETAVFEDFGIVREVLKSKRSIKLVGQTFQTIDAPIETYQVAIPAVWTNEFYGTKSFLAVPVIYQGRAIGIIECYAFLPHEFSDQQIAAIQGCGTLISTLFQRNRVSGIVSSLNQSFSLLSSEEQVYHKVMELIETYLNTKTVSIWEKKPKEANFDFELITASDKFRQEHEANSILNLTENSITARVANGLEPRIRHFSRSELEQEGAEYANFLNENNLRSLTVVPITICGHVNAVIDVFYEDDRRLFLEDEDFLRVLAGRAAAAIWTKKLALSFKAIADEVLASRSIEMILKKIAFTARSVLFADLVILFPYNPLRREFGEHQLSGQLFKKVGIYKGEKKEKDFVDLMINRPGPVYLQDTEQYERFCEENGRRPSPSHDFWHREKVCSMAAVQLIDGRKASLGVMFFNYRSPFTFDYATKHVIDSFASQTASALVSRNFGVTRTREQIAEVELVELLNNLAVSLDQFILPLDPPPGSEETGKPAREQLTDYLDYIRKLKDDIDEKRKFFTQGSDWNNHDLGDLVESVLALLDNRFKELRIRPQTNCPKLPRLYCDSTQIRNLLYQLLSILLDAIQSPAPSLTIATKSHEQGDSLSVHMVLGGGRLSNDQLQAIYDQPLLPSYGDAFKVPGRYETCRILAQCLRAKVTIEPTDDGLICVLEIFY